VTGGISKVSDDTTQLIIEAISSTATDASTAGVARFAAMGATAIFFLTRHGRDVILPPYTEMDVSLSRAVSLGSGSPTLEKVAAGQEPESFKADTREAHRIRECR
jgi:voltage-gated potassium channel Kch